jgi:hypothetical protein
MISILMLIVMVVPQMSEPVRAASPQVTFEKAQIIDAEGNLTEATEDLDASFSKTLPATAANIAGGSSSIQIKNWARAKYDFVGFRMNGKMLEPAEMTPGTTTNGEQVPKQEILEGYTTSSGNLYVQQASSFTSWIYALYSSGPTAVTQDISVYPVFRERTASDKTFEVNAEEGGSVSSEIINGKADTYYMKATPAVGYVFDAWEIWDADMNDWTVTDLEQSCIVAIDASAKYRATFMPLDIDSLEVKEYSMQKDQDTWTLSLETVLDQPCASNTPVKYSVYDAEGNALIEDYSNSVSNGKDTATPTVTLNTKPSDPTGKITVKAKLDNGNEIETEYELSGTLDFDQEPITIDWTKAIFLGMEGYEKEFDLSVTGDPAVENVKFSTTSAYATIDNEGHAVFGGRPFSTQYINFRAETQDGRAATLRCTMNLTNGVKIDEESILQKEGTDIEYGYLSSANQMTAVSVSGWKISAESSDEDLFTAEVTQYKKTGWPSCNDHIQGVLIHAKKAGKGFVTLRTGSTGNYHVVPVTITSADIGLDELILDKETAEVQTDESITLKTQIEPETASVSYKWKSSDPSVATVKNGVVTGVKEGTATITVTATDEQGYSLKAFCDVTVKDDPYRVEVYVPKNAVDEIHFYPTNGFDDETHDLFDAAEEIEPESVDTESNEDYDIYVMPLMKGTYSYRASWDEMSLGGGAFEVPSDFDNGTTTSGGEKYGRSGVKVYLKEAEFYALNKVEDTLIAPEKYSVKMQSKVGTITMGDIYANDDEIDCYHALIVAGGNALLYDEVFTPSPELASAEKLGSVVRNSHDIAMNTNTEVITNTMPVTEEFRLNAPVGSVAKLYTQIKNYNTKEILPSAIELKEDGTQDFIFFVKATTSMSYRVSKEGEKTQAGYLSSNQTSAKVEFEGNPFDIDTSGLSSMESSTMLNINEKNKLVMSKGEVFKARAYRAGWQIVNNVTGNIMIEPDFHYNVISGSDVIDIAQMDGGNSTGNWANITAKKEGIAIVEVGYDALGVTNGANNIKYGATDPNRKSVFVVAVGGETADIGGIDWDTEEATVYYTGDEGIWTIEPDCDNAEVEVMHVENGALGSETEVAGKDGVFDVPVKAGNNIVKITSAGKTDYRVVRASKLEISVTPQSGEETVKPGDIVDITFRNVYYPVPKMASIYNPGYGGTMKYQYYMNGKTVATTGVQYNLLEQKLTVTIPEDAEDKVVLTDGQIIGDCMGDYYGQHRTLTDIGAAANFNAIRLPIEPVELSDIEIEVAGDIEDADREAALASINGKYDELLEDNEYKAADKEKLKSIRDAAIEEVNAAKAKKNMENIVSAAIEDMETVKPTSVADEKSALAKTISKAEELTYEIEEGDAEDEYAVGTKDALEQAIVAAQAVYDDADATVDEIDQANTALNRAIETAKNSRNDKTLEKAKNDAIKEIADFAAEREGKADQDKIDLEKLKGIEAVRAAGTAEEIEEAVKACKKAINTVITEEKIARQQEFEEAKSNAKDLIAGIDPEDYRDEVREGQEKTDREIVSELIGGAAAGLEKAKTVSDVSGIVSDLLYDLAEIPTAEEMDNKELAKEKEDAVKELEEYLKANEKAMNDRRKTEAELAALKAIVKIKDAATVKDAEAEKEAAIAAIDKAVADTKEDKAKTVKTITVNVKTVNAKALDKIAAKKGGSAKYITKVILGKKVKKIAKKSFAKYKKVTTLTVKTKKLKKKTVKGSLKGSNVKTVQVKVGKKKVNKKFVKKYKKIFTKKIAGKKVTVK